MRVERTVFAKYEVFLRDKYRPPSKGGNTRAWHSHVLTIDGTSYSFLALGAKKWAFAGEELSFDWSWDESEKYRNVARETIKVWTKAGEPVVRGERGSKPWRTATTRLPARRREWKD